MIYTKDGHFARARTKKGILKYVPVADIRDGWVKEEEMKENGFCTTLNSLTGKRNEMNL